MIEQGGSRAGGLTGWEIRMSSVRVECLQRAEMVYSGVGKHTETAERVCRGLKALREE